MSKVETTGITKAMNHLLFEINVNGNDDLLAEAMAKALAKEHRTIQQSFFRLFVKAMDTYKDSGSDGRNEGSIQLAKDIANNKISLPYI